MAVIGPYIVRERELITYAQKTQDAHFGDLYVCSIALRCLAGLAFIGAGVCFIAACSPPLGATLLINSIVLAVLSHDAWVIGQNIREELITDEFNLQNVRNVHKSIYNAFHAFEMTPTTLENTWVTKWIFSEFLFIIQRTKR